MTTAPPQVYPSVDWLTATCADPYDGDYAYGKARALAVEQETAGDTIRPWGANGFRGFSTPHLRCGVRDTEVLVELSGHLADIYWKDFYAVSSNVSRLDTCVTVTFPAETRDVAIDGFKAAPVSVRRGFPTIRKTIWEQRDGGQTLYLGSPKSSRMGRLYDKTAESGGDWAPNTWRWELQERRHMGSARARLLDGSDDVYRAITASVHGFFSYHGVNPWFQSDGPIVFAPARRPRSDLSRRLDYYRKSIAPGVRRGIDRGHGAVILAALGLAADELRPLLLDVAGQLDPSDRRGEPHIKESSQCQPGNVLEDLTPPRTSQRDTASVHPTKDRPEAIYSATAAKGWPRTSRTGST